MSLMPKASSCWPQTDRIRLGLRLVQAGSAKVRNVGGNQLRLSAGSAEGSGLRLAFGSHSTRGFDAAGNSIQIYHKTEPEQIEMPESRWLARA